MSASSRPTARRPAASAAALDESVDRQLRLAELKRVISESGAAPLKVLKDARALRERLSEEVRKAAKPSKEAKAKANEAIVAERKAVGQASSPCPGVSWDKKKRTWRAHITVGGTQKSVGRFAEEDEADAAVKAAKAKVGAK